MEDAASWAHCTLICQHVPLSWSWHTRPVWCGVLQLPLVGFLWKQGNNSQGAWDVKCDEVQKKNNSKTHHVCLHHIHTPRAIQLYCVTFKKECDDLTNGQKEKSSRVQSRPCGNINISGSSESVCPRSRCHSQASDWSAAWPLHYEQENSTSEASSASPHFQKCTSLFPRLRTDSGLERLGLHRRTRLYCEEVIDPCAQNPPS